MKIPIREVKSAMAHLKNAPEVEKCLSGQRMDAIRASGMAK